MKTPDWEQRYKAWCRGEPLDRSRDYHALDSIVRFEAYELHIAEQAREILIEQKEHS